MTRRCRLGAGLALVMVSSFLAVAAERGGALVRSIRQRATRQGYGTQTSTVSKTPSEVRLNSGRHSSPSAHCASAESHLGKH